MNYRIVIVGEAWGDHERAAQAPFVGPSGKLLYALLAQAGIDKNECFFTNVFNLQPEPKNDIVNLCGTKEEAIKGFPPIQSGKYISAKYEPELDRLFTEIKAIKPTLIIACGASAAWALLGTSGIKKIRGAPAAMAGRAKRETGLSTKVLPTYHPAAILREFTLRPTVIADLLKARREAEYPEIIRPKREIWIEPSLTDLADFEQYINDSDSLSIDIETSRDQITCIGFAPSVDRAIVVPIVDVTQRDGNYWRTLDDELKAWEYIRYWCSLAKRIVGQNFLYDTHFLWRNYGITVPFATDDTMLLHHALQPELEKGLGYLASVYTDELPWKFMRPKHETIKQED